MNCMNCNDKFKCDYYTGKKLCEGRKEKLNYSELRKEIQKVLCDFLSYEHPLQNDGEFDFDFLEFKTDDILKLIKRQGGTVTNESNRKNCENR